MTDPAGSELSEVRLPATPTVTPLMLLVIKRAVALWSALNRVSHTDTRRKLEFAKTSRMDEFCGNERCAEKEDIVFAACEE
jgi:hypothetical protein